MFNFKTKLLSAIFACLLFASPTSAEFFSDVILTGTDGIWVDSRSYASLQAAVTTVGGADREIVIIGAQAATTLVVPANVRLKFLRDGSINNTGQLTINTRNIVAEDRQIFTGTGDIDFIDGSVVRSSWFSNAVEALDVTLDDTLTMIISETGRITANSAVGNNVSLKWESSDNRLIVYGGRILSNVKNLEAGNYQIFAGAGDIDFLDGTELYLNWFRRLRSVLTWIETEEVTIIVSEDDTVDYTQVSTANENIKFILGSTLTIPGGVDLTLNGQFECDRRQAFSGNITGVSFGVGAVKEAYPEWFGAVGNGVTDCSAAIQACIDSLPLDSGWAVQFSNGDYYVASAIDLPLGVGGGGINTYAILGSGTRITTDQAISIFQRLPTDYATAVAAVNCRYHFADILFLGDRTVDQIGIQLGATYGSVIERCSFNSLDTGMDLIFSLMGEVRNCRFTNNGSVGLLIESSRDVWAGAYVASNFTTVYSSKVHCLTGSDTGFKVLHSDGVRLQDCIVEGGNPTYNVYFDNQSYTSAIRFEIDGLHSENTPTDSVVRLTSTGGGGGPRIIIDSLYHQSAAGSGIIINALDFVATSQIVVNNLAYIPTGWQFRNNVASTYGSRWIFRYAHAGLGEFNAKDPTYWVGGDVPRRLDVYGVGTTVKYGSTYQTMISATNLMLEAVEMRFTKPTDAAVYQGWVFGENPTADERVTHLWSRKATLDFGGGGTVGANTTIIDTIVLPSTAWTGLTLYALNAEVVPTVVNEYLYRCTVGGTSAAGEPVWPTVVGDTVVDGTATWRCLTTRPTVYGGKWTVYVTPKSKVDLNRRLTWSAYVSAADTITVILSNPTIGAVNFNTIEWRVDCWQHRT